MNLIEAYASDCGVKIDHPWIYQRYFPMPFEKYILFHAGGNFPSKRYDYYNEVISLLRPILKENGYQLLQIGKIDDNDLNFIVDLRGKTDIHQSAYLIGRAALLIGNDSFPVHVASSLNVPVVSLYGSTTPQNHGPYFGRPENKILLESHRNGQLPSFSAQDPNKKTINLIKPEEIANAALKLLKIDKNINRETLYIGDRYNEFIVEVVMDTIISSDVFANSMLGARMDLHFNEEILEKNLQIRPLTITTNKPINLDLLKKYRKHIGNIVYEIKEDYSIDFVKQMMFNGIKYSLFTRIPENKLDLIKLDFFDYGAIEIKESANFKKAIENYDIKITSNSKYKTMKFLAAKDKWFLNEVDWKQDKPIENIEKNISNINLKNPEFWDDLEFMYIYNEIN